VHPTGRVCARPGGEADDPASPVREGDRGRAGPAAWRAFVCDPSDRLSAGAVRSSRSRAPDRGRVRGSVGTPLSDLIPRPVSELPVPHQLVREAGIGGVAAARVRHDEDGRVADTLRLWPRPWARRRAEELPVRGATDERHHRGLDRRDRPRQPRAAARVVVGRQLRGFARGALGDVGQRQPELGKANGVGERERLGDEAGGVQQAIERVARPREMMTDPADARLGLMPTKRIRGFGQSRAGSRLTWRGSAR